MSADENEAMGELINLEEWKHQKELEEIERLRAEIREIQARDDLPEQSPYYPKEYFNPKLDPVCSDEEVLEVVDPPGYFQFDPLQSAIATYTVQVSESDSLPVVGPDAGFGPGVAYRAGESVRDIIDRILDSALVDICRSAALDQEED